MVYQILIPRKDDMGGPILNPHLSQGVQGVCWGDINQKTKELSQYLQGKRKRLDFSKPKANPKSYDTYDYRQRIMDMEYADWVGMGMNRSTLHYLKKRIKEGKPLNLNRHIRERLGG